VRKKAPAVHQTVEASPGVYFLFDQHGLVYIGESDNMFRRVASHSDHKEFVTAFGIPMPDMSVQERKRIEAKFIAALRGHYNLQAGPGGRFSSVDAQSLAERVAALIVPPKPEKAHPAMPTADTLLVSPKQAAVMLGVGRSKIFEMLASGQLHARKLGRLTMIERASVIEFMNGLPPARRDPPTDA
jgi:excisionase family DNA binding protein